MRVALVVPRYAPAIGGVETHCERLACGLAARGHEVEVFAQTTARSSCELRDGVRVHRFRRAVPARHLVFAPGLWAALRRDGGSFDIVHAHSYHALPALAAALTTSAGLVFTPHFHGRGHSPLRTALHRVYLPAGRAVFHRAAAVICVSEAEAALVRRRFAGLDAKIVVIPNGVDVDPIRAATPFLWPGRLLLSVGRLEAYKHVERAVEALALLPADWSLAIVGAGPAAAQLRHRIATCGVDDRARLLGTVDDEHLRRWYRTASAFLTMSTDEAFGIAPLEALAAGAAVVASDIPAHREARGLSGAGGRFVLVDPAADAAALATALCSATSARADAGPSLPSWDDVVERTLAVYARVVEARG